MARTVLVVGDDDSLLEVIANMLVDLGCQVVCAASGSDALDQLRRNEQISILITDINMPGMDGHELAERAQRVSPELKILQLSGRERRRDGYPMIRKPFSRGRPSQHHATNDRHLLNLPSLCSLPRAAFAGAA